MLPVSGYGGMLRQGGVVSGSVMGNAAALFSAERMPWSQYVATAGGKPDAASFDIPAQPKPMYRGAARGREGYYMKENTQLHYRRYPDESIYHNLHRWLRGATVQDLNLQQFKNAQPFSIERPNEEGWDTPDRETYMKLNYKNPAVLSRFLTRTGHYYPQDVLPLNPVAIVGLKSALRSARILGLYPRTGNPFWQRTQKYRPQATQGDYNPASAAMKETMEHYCYNTLQVHRLKQYFQQLENNMQQAAMVTSSASMGSAGKGSRGAKAKGNDVGYTGKEIRFRAPGVDYTNANTPFSEKVTTVPGLLSTQGLRKSFNLYSKTSKRRMGVENPGNIKKN